MPPSASAPISSPTRGTAIADGLAGIAGLAVVRIQQFASSGGTAQAMQSAVRAARLLAAAEAVNEATQARVWPAHRAEIERSVAVVRAHLDQAAFEAAWGEGRVMTPEQALAYAREQVV